jgi:NADH-quinone oxidoreductase subunit M
MTGIVSPLWLTVLIVLPLAGTGVCLLLAGAPRLCRGAALATTLAVFAVALRLFVLLKGSHGRWLLLYADHPWIPRFGIRYTLGLDGLSLLMVLLTAFLLVIAVLVSWREIDSRLPFHYGLLLLLEAGVLGVFLSLDLVLFYLFWELMLIPMFFLIGIWGQGRRIYAAVKFFLFTFAGSLLMLLAILALYLFHGRQTGDYTFALLALQGTHLPAGLAPWLYAAFLLAFAIKVPLFPVHTWLPDVYTQAPSAVILAGLLLETGVYGILRFAIPLFPEAARASFPLLAGLALIGIFYAAWIAYAQKDAKRLVAYSSVAHLGFVALGLAAWDRVALEGSILQMVNHGITTGALFVMIGMIDARAKTRQLDQLGGLWGKAPRLGGLFLLFSLAAIGLPGLNNFVGEILILIGTFQSHPLWGAVAMGGVVFAAIYILRLLKGVLWGPARSDAPFPDLTLREALILVPLAVLVFWLGLYPTTFLAPIHEPVQHLLHGLPLVALKGGMP